MQWACFEQSAIMQCICVSELDMNSAKNKLMHAQIPQKESKVRNLSPTYRIGAKRVNSSLEIVPLGNLTNPLSPMVRSYAHPLPKYLCWLSKHNWSKKRRSLFSSLPTKIPSNRYYPCCTYKPLFSKTSSGTPSLLASSLLLTSNTTASLRAAAVPTILVCCSETEKKRKAAKKGQPQLQRR